MTTPPLRITIQTPQAFSPEARRRLSAAYAVLITPESPATVGTSVAATAVYPPVR